jgi:hypothetical protein
MANCDTKRRSDRYKQKNLIIKSNMEFEILAKLGDWIQKDQQLIKSGRTVFTSPEAGLLLHVHTGDKTDYSGFVAGIGIPIHQTEINESTNADKQFFHVTFRTRTPKILQQGVVSGKRRNWNNAFGNKLGEKKVYVFSDFTMAVRWAHKMEYEFEKPTDILIVKVGETTSDDHIEAQMNGKTWFKTDDIPPENIVRVIPLTRELIKQVAQTGSAEIP